jgi:hypothetical protein
MIRLHLHPRDPASSAPYSVAGRTICGPPSIRRHDVRPDASHVRHHRVAGRLAARFLVLALVASGFPLLAAAPAFAARSKSLSIADANVIEAAGGTTIAFTVKWTGVKGGPAPSVGYATSNGTATAASDYTAKSGTATLANAGCRCATISVSVLDDAVSEDTETFAVTLSDATNATIADGSAIGTIYDNEGPAALVVTDASADENAGPLTFSVKLTNASGTSISVAYASADGSATAGSDYTATSNTLTFNGGQTSKTVTVALTNDALSEDDETLSLNLSSPSGASIIDAQGTGTIGNDDPDPNVSIDDAIVGEGDGDAATASFTVTLSAASGQETSVAWSTSDGGALAGSDYEGASGTTTIPAGQLTGTVDVAVIGDLTHEGDETFSVTIADPIGLTLVDATATATITDDDPIPSVSVGDVVVSEGAGSASLTLSLSNPSVSDVSFTWATADGTATAGSDYTSSGAGTSIAAGDTSVTAEVPIVQDTADESAETFSVTITDVTNGTVGAAGTVTIDDDDASPTAMTLKVSAGRKVKVKGTLEPATTGLSITLTLSRKKGTRYVRVTSKTVAVKSLLDRDADGVVDGGFRTAFPRPGRGAYRMTAVFAGSAALDGTSRSVNFRV